MKIINGICRYIFDSKGFATIEVEIFLDSGDTGIGAAPRGSTTGHYDIQYNEYYPRGNNFSPILDGNIEFFNENILPRISNREVEDIEDITELDKNLFDIPEIENYGNVAIACSYAIWEAFSKNKKLPLWKLFFEPGSASKGQVKHLVNIIDGKPDSLLAGFEFLLVSEKEITFQSLLEISNIKNELMIKFKNQGFYTSISNQGALIINTDDFYIILDSLLETLKLYNNRYAIGLDLAMTDRYDSSLGIYKVPWCVSQQQTVTELMDTYCDWGVKYPLVYLEDLFSDEDLDSWRKFQSIKPLKLQVFGDDFYATNLERISQFKDCADGIVIKPNQVGSVSKTLEVMEYAEKSGISMAFSQRTAETENNIISHLAMSVTSSYLKAGGLDRLDRIAKYNEVLRNG